MADSLWTPLSQPSYWGFRRSRRQPLALTKRDPTATAANQCQCCGFCSRIGMEAVQIGDSQPPVIACAFCAPAFAVGYAGAQDAITLIWLPELTQADVSHLCRVLFIAEALSGKRGIGAARGLAEYANSLYNTLRGRRACLEKTLGEGMSDPRVLAGQLHKLDSAAYQRYRPVLAGIRLLPEKAAFVETVRAWAKEWQDSNNYPLAAWEKVLLALSRQQPVSG